MNTVSILANNEIDAGLRTRNSFHQPRLPST